MNEFLLIFTYSWVFVILLKANFVNNILCFRRSTSAYGSWAFLQKHLLILN